MKAYARPIILGLSCVALIASVYGLYVHYQMLSDPAYSPVCNVSATVSCGDVLTSPYGTAFGIPVAAGGAIWSALVLLLSLTGMSGRPGSDRFETTAGYIFVLSVVGLAAVFYLGYASFFVLQKMCPLCVAIYIAVIGIFLASSSASSASLASLPGRLMRDLRTVFLQPVAATLAILWLAGSVSLIAFFPRETPVPAAQTAAVALPQEGIAADELAAWHAWLDQAPRVPEMSPTGDVKVRLVKFNDYQCPSCRMTWSAYGDVIAQMQAKYPGRFLYETLDYPLEPECGTGGMHGGACESAVAVRLAKEKGKGAEMETWLYTHQAELSRDRVREAVKDVAGVEDFDARYPEVLEKVRADAQLGNKLGITGTPTFFLNGIRMSSSPRATYLAAAIEHEMQKAGS
jgi:uncharacterized membrane protein